MVIAGKRRKGGAQEVFSLAGIVLRPEAAKQEENRIYTLLLKGVLVYLFELNITLAILRWGVFFLGTEILALFFLCLLVWIL